HLLSPPLAPPTPPLLPYTTLFRSHPDPRDRAAHARDRRGIRERPGIERPLPPDREVRRRRLAGEGQVLLDVASCNGEVLLYRRRDRKSTRLNSSHRTISYAVFCLK